MSLLVWAVLVGTITGVLARRALPGAGWAGTRVTILIGMGGCLLGGVVASGLGLNVFATFICSPLGAVFVLVLHSAQATGRAPE